MQEWNAWSRPELDGLTYALLKAMGGQKTAAHESGEHTWTELCFLPGAEAADRDTVRGLLHTLNRIGYLVSLENRGDCVVCGGLTQSGLAWVRVREGKSAQPLVTRRLLIDWAVVTFLGILLPGGIAKCLAQRLF